MNVNQTAKRRRIPNWDAIRAARQRPRRAAWSARGRACGRVIVFEPRATRTVHAIPRNNPDLPPAA